MLANRLSAARAQLLCEVRMCHMIIGPMLQIVKLAEYCAVTAEPHQAEFGRGGID